ncbi:OFA family MFS transporter [Megasphaera paucivorans]|uniref:MFS transporter, OFA family, oxalate/formate antiporter n=1 Tax=Megasphaera paucivorans TaxID=349095 RepID=A0A1G9YSF9_9FIRM|nr:OFA family MFS transporter [Megasphaera paucivorans]SDN12062.1 MFS transporter, OFA family, oxalate/formate antiporter [Megasphaera paucivorans]
MKKNRWLIALSAMGIHICIGSVYAWSVLTKPIMETMGFTLKETTWTFSLAILFLGLSAGFLGSFVQKIGPKKSGLMSMGFFCTGMFGTAAALYFHNLFLMYLSYGIIGGIGLGTGYITPVSTLVKWFPDNRGFATGLAIMGFGFASMIAGPAMQILVQHFGLVTNFIILGIVYMSIMTASSLYLAPPKLGEVPTTDTLLKEASEKNIVQYADAMPQFTVKQAMKKWQLYTIWWLFFTNITCGIALLAVASPMAQEVVHMSPMMAASMVGIIGFMNGAGRIAWATVSDYIGRSNTYILFFAIEILAFFKLASITSSFSFQIVVLLIITCYGGGFSCMPAYLSDLFGTKELSAIHGRILTAWGAAGVAGPLLLSFIKETTNSYAVTLQFFSGCFVVALLIMIFLKMKTRHGLAETEERVKQNEVPSYTNH